MADRSFRFFGDTKNLKLGLYTYMCLCACVCVTVLHTWKPDDILAAEITTQLRGYALGDTKEQSSNQLID